MMLDTKWPCCTVSAKSRVRESGMAGIGYRWLLLALLLAPLPAFAADPPGKPVRPSAAPAKPAVKAPAKPDVKAAKPVPAAAVGKAGFTAKDLQKALGRDRTLLTVGAKPLPPAVRKALVRGKPIPPAASPQAVPKHLLEQLPDFEGHGWMRAGTDLLLVATAGKRVVDIVEDVFD